MINNFMIYLKKKICHYNSELHNIITCLCVDSDEHCHESTLMTKIAEYVLFNGFKKHLIYFKLFISLVCCYILFKVVKKVYNRFRHSSRLSRQHQASPVEELDLNLLTK